VLCRGWSLPAVVDIQHLHINESKKEALCSSEPIREFTDLVLNGNSGQITFCPKGVFRNQYKDNKAAKPHIQDVCSMLSSFDDMALFQRLPLHVQQHFAALKLSLRRVGF
jgi:hypothetical protein